jgi:hypothetical protein
MEFEEPVTDLQALVRIGAKCISRDGYSTRKLGPRQENVKPSVMTAFLSPDKRMIIFASSMKKANHERENVLTPKIIYANQETKAFLDQATQFKHRTGAWEIVALYMGAVRLQLIIAH